MKKPPAIKTIVVPIYGTTVRVFATYQAAEKYYKCHMEGESLAAFVQVMNHTGSGITEIAICFSGPDCCTINTITHELVHAAWRVLDHVGVTVDSGNHEAFAYLVGYLAENITPWAMAHWQHWEDSRNTGTAETTAKA